MGEVVYRSKVRIEKKKGSLRHARLPAHEGPVLFGVHGAVRDHYDRPTEEEITTTLDYVVAAAAG